MTLFLLYPRNGHGNILSEDECSSSKEDERMSELNECRTIISELYEDIGTINTKTLTLEYRIDNIFGEDCSINKSIVHVSFTFSTYETFLLNTYDTYLCYF